MDGACEERIKAGLEYALNQAASAGHTCVPEELLLRETVRLLQVSSSVVNDVFKAFGRGHAAYGRSWRFTADLS